jgi:hypothetical protein
MARHMFPDHFVALPSTSFRALSNGIGLKMIGAAVLQKFAIRPCRTPGWHVPDHFVALPSTTLRALSNGIGFDCDRCSGLVEIRYSVLLGMLGPMSQITFLQLPSTTFRALFYGPGFNMIGAEVG